MNYEIERSWSMPKWSNYRTYKLDKLKYPPDSQHRHLTDSTYSSPNTLILVLYTIVLNSVESVQYSQ